MADATVTLMQPGNNHSDMHQPSAVAAPVYDAPIGLQSAVQVVWLLEQDNRFRATLLPFATDRVGTIKQRGAPAWFAQITQDLSEDAQLGSDDGVVKAVVSLVDGHGTFGRDSGGHGQLPVVSRDLMPALLLGDTRLPSVVVKVYDSLVTIRRPPATTRQSIKAYRCEEGPETPANLTSVAIYLVTAV